MPGDSDKPWTQERKNKVFGKAGTRGRKAKAKSGGGSSAGKRPKMGKGKKGPKRDHNGRKR